MTDISDNNIQSNINIEHNDINQINQNIDVLNINTDINTDINKLLHIAHIIKAIGYTVHNPSVPQSYINLCIAKGFIDQPTYIDEIRDYIPILKESYSSHSLTCLQSNAEDKQQYPNLNLLRQILKCNGFKLKSQVRSGGYDKGTGKKIVYREYLIDWLK